MKIKSILILAMIMLPFLMKAQSTDVYPGSSKAVVIVENFNPGYGVDRRDFRWVDVIRNYVKEGLSNSGRIVVMDVNDIMELRAYDPQESGTLAYMKERYKLMKENGAEYSIECDVTGITAVRDNKSEKPRWVSTIAYTIRIIDVNTGKVLDSVIADPKYNQMSGDQPDKAINSTADLVKSKMNRYVLNNFRVEGQILQLISTKKNEAKEVVINVGPANGIYNGGKLEVYRVSTIAGRQITDKIGEVKIKEVKANDLSYAEVKKGGKEILEALNNNEVLQILSCKAGFWD